MVIRMNKKIGKKKLIILLLLMMPFLFLGTYNLFENIYGDKNNLKILLNGAKNIVVEVGDSYNELGAIAYYKNEKLKDKMEIKSNVDDSKLGNYTVNYKIKYKDVEKEINRNVKVVDSEKPTIKLLGNNRITIIKGNKYIEYGAVAYDNYDKDLTSKITIDDKDVNTNEVGDYKVIYTVKDESGNKTKIEREVIVTDNIKKEQKVAVLNYHFYYKEKNENCDESICLDIKRFKEQLDYLKENNFYTLTMEEFVRWIYNEIEIPEKSVLITIDDGAHGTSKTNGNHLIPLLEEYKMHATLFLITGWWNIEDYKSDYLDIESHTNDLHYEAKCGYRSKVNCVSSQELEKDLKESIKVVNSNKAFCYPYYEYNDKTINIVKKLGFKVAFTGGNTKATLNVDKYKIPRYIIYDSTSIGEFKKIVN